jgi:hypothetical protein
MTAPPGGPYDPYGNPYGQQPYWGGQPQGGGYQYPPPDQYPPPGQYPPPTGPYTNPQGGGDPYGAGAYPPPQYPQTGPQAQPGWGYPPGPPPGRPGGSKTPWLIIAGIAVVGIIALVVILVIGLSNGNKPNTASPTETPGTTSAPTSASPGSEQTATGCTPNVSGGDKPTTDTVSAGKLQFSASAAPGWQAISDDQSPNLIGAVGVAKEVPGASQWVMQAEVAVTNFVPSMDVAAQASKLLQCVVAGPGYANSQPTLGPTKTSSITVDGTKAARVDADVTIADPARNVKGDSVTIIAVDTKPVTIFLGATAIGDTASAAIISKVIASLKVSRK